jgi:hypothetical protein
VEAYKMEFTTRSKRFEIPHPFFAAVYILSIALIAFYLLSASRNFDDVVVFKSMFLRGALSGIVFVILCFVKLIFGIRIFGIYVVRKNNYYPGRRKQ